jgi:hypothetical protein
MKSKYLITVLFICFFGSLKALKAQSEAILEKEKYEFSLKQAQEFALENSIKTKNND